MTKLPRLLECLIFLIFCFSQVFGQKTSLPIGKVDRSYGENGFSFFGLGQNSFGGDMIILPDGKMVLVTMSPAPNGRPSIQVVRLNTDGTLDPAFGNNGRATYSFGEDTYGTNIAALPNGKLLITGYTSLSLNQNDFLVFRITANGELDPSFANNGALIKDFPQPTSGDFSDDQAGSLLILPDGKLLVAGSSNYYNSTPSRGTTYSTLVRLGPNGSIDNSFGNNGVAQAFVGNDSTNVSYGRPPIITQQGDGNFLIGITAERADLVSASDFLPRCVVQRYLSGGTLDQTFGSKGTKVFFPGQSSTFNDFEVLPNGKILVLAGYALMRANPDGSPDPDFGDSGTVSLYPGGFGDILVSNDEKITLSGGQFVPNVPGPGGYQIGLLRRFHSNGIPDLRFGTSGVSSIIFPDDSIGLGRMFPINDRQNVVLGLRNYSGLRLNFTMRFSVTK